MPRIESAPRSNEQPCRNSRRLGVLRLGLAAGPLLALACGGGGRPDYSLRNTPPEVSFAVAPPAYVAKSSLALSITATNPAGVKAVYALCGSVRWPAVRQDDGTWRAALQLPAVGKNTVTVWAEDNASPTPNSGLGMDPPYQLVQEIIYDPTPPSVSYDASFPSYADERRVEVAVDGNGVALVPAAYTIGAKTAVLPGGDFYKASTRLSAGTSMSANELETTNRQNIPVLRFTVPYMTSTDSPVQPPTFTAHVTCPNPCPEFPDATGQLLPAAALNEQVALFDLPLAAETIPALAKVQGPASLSITLTVADAAGNSTTASGFNFVLHVIGPPLAIVEDGQYPTTAQADGATTFAYHVSNNTYAALWDTTRFPNAAVRLMRYVITNPAPVPVALNLRYIQAAGGSWQAYEDWKWYSVAEPLFRGQSVNQKTSCYDAQPYTLDGFSFAQPLCTSAGSAVQCWTGAAWSTSVMLFHRMGDRTYQYLCTSTTLVNGTIGEAAGVGSVGDVAVESFRVAPELGGQERAPDTDASGQWAMVPAASGGTPGTLVVYLKRPAGVARSPALNWNVNVVSGAEFTDHYQTWEYMQWFQLSTPTSGYDWRTGLRLGRYLVSAEDRVYGTLAGTTQPYSEGSFLGEAADRVSVTLSRAPLFTH